MTKSKRNSVLVMVYDNGKPLQGAKVYQNGIEGPEVKVTDIEGVALITPSPKGKRSVNITSEGYTPLNATFYNNNKPVIAELLPIDPPETKEVQTVQKNQDMPVKKEAVKPIKTEVLPVKKESFDIVNILFIVLILVLLAFLVFVFYKLFKGGAVKPSDKLPGSIQNSLVKPGPTITGPKIIKV